MTIRAVNLESLNAQCAFKFGGIQNVHLEEQDWLERIDVMVFAFGQFLVLVFAPIAGITFVGNDVQTVLLQNPFDQVLRLGVKFNRLNAKLR